MSRAASSDDRRAQVKDRRPETSASMWPPHLTAVGGGRPGPATEPARKLDPSATYASAMAWLLAHVVTFAAVTALLIGIWLVSGGSVEELELIVDDPVDGIGD